MGRQSAAASGESRDEEGKKGGEKKGGTEKGGRKSVEQTEYSACVERINGGCEDEREVERGEEERRAGGAE